MSSPLFQRPVFIESHAGKHSLTFLIAGAITRGDITVTGCPVEHLGALIVKLRQTGVEITQTDSTTLRVRGLGPLRSVDVTTEEYPGFATDLQAQYMALMPNATG